MDMAEAFLALYPKVQDMIVSGNTILLKRERVCVRIEEGKARLVTYSRQAYDDANKAAEFQLLLMEGLELFALKEIKAEGDHLAYYSVLRSIHPHNLYAFMLAFMKDINSLLSADLKERGG